MPRPVRLTLAVAVMLTFTAAAPALGQEEPAAPQGVAQPKLRPGDVVRLKIWREPDLSGDFLVDERGTVVFPKIGPHGVTEESPESLREHLVSAYQVYLRNPSIDVTLLRRVNILGAVRSPGLYPIDATMTLADALALAGGATPLGRPDRVDLIRDGSAEKISLSTRSRIVDTPIQSGDKLWVPERSWVSRNSGVIAAGITASVSLVVALVAR